MRYIFLCLFCLIFTFSKANAEHKEIKVAAFLEPPFIDVVNNQWVGENIDVVKLLSEKTGFTPVFIRCPFARCLSMVKKGQADMIMGIRKSPEREQLLTYIEPPYLLQHKPLRFFTLNTRNIAINQFGDLDKLIVGTLRGGAYFQQFDEDKNIRKVEITSREQLVKMLLKGHIDTFLEREETIRPLLSKQDYQEKITLADYQYDQPVGSYIAISKKSPINHHVKQFSLQLEQAILTGQIKQIRDKYQQQFSH